MGENREIVDLAYIKEMTDGEESAMEEMIDIFIEQAPEFISQLKDNLNDKNWEELAGIAHQAKSSYAVMGMEETAAILKDIELDAKKQHNVQLFVKKIEKVENDCNQAINELKTNYKKS